MAVELGANENMERVECDFMRLCSGKWMETETRVSESRQNSTTPVPIVFLEIRLGSIHWIPINFMTLDMHGMAEKGVYEGVPVVMRRVPGTYEFASICSRPDLFEPLEKEEADERIRADAARQLLDVKVKKGPA